jgi:hypothetical protein
MTRFHSERPQWSSVVSVATCQGETKLWLMHLLIWIFERMSFDIEVDVKSTSRRRFPRCTARR